MKRNSFLPLIALFIPLLFSTSCIKAYVQSVGGNTTQVFDRVFYTDPQTSWQAILDALKHSRLDVTNHEGGWVQTRWTDNTAEKNFSDSFGGTDSYLKAQYRLRIIQSSGIFHERKGVKISVQKEQLVQRDVLEDWQPTETDSIEETTLLYRIGRLIYIKMKINQLDQEKISKELDTPSP